MKEQQEKQKVWLAEQKRLGNDVSKYEKVLIFLLLMSTPPTFAFRFPFDNADIWTLVCRISIASPRMQATAAGHTHVGNCGCGYVDPDELRRIQYVRTEEALLSHAHPSYYYTVYLSLLLDPLPSFLVCHMFAFFFFFFREERIKNPPLPLEEKNVKKVRVTRSRLHNFHFLIHTDAHAQATGRKKTRLD